MLIPWWAACSFFISLSLHKVYTQIIGTFDRKYPIFGVVPYHLSSMKARHIGIFNISLTSCWTKRNSNTLFFHLLFSWSIKKWTMRECYKTKLCVITWNSWGTGIHALCCTQILFPYPTLHRKPIFRRCFPSQMLCQMYDGRWPSFACMKDVFLKYLARKTLATREWGFCTSLHPCLASSAKLTASRSLKPSPLSTFILHRDSHFFQRMAFSFCPFFH